MMDLINNLELIFKFMKSLITLYGTWFMSSNFLDILELFGINSIDRTAWLLPSVLDFNTFNAQVFIISLIDSRKITYILTVG
jgi:hypothetical protein